MEVLIKKVENGYVLQATKWDYINRTQDVKVYTYPTLDEVLNKVKEL